jgi:hypothetical protein
MVSNLRVHPVTGDISWARVVRLARCADSGLHPDEWFPVGIDPATARREAAAAIAVCASCLVRADCLALSLRHWDVGQHGVWGGLVAADRARLRRRWPVDHRNGRRRAAVAAMIAQPSSLQVPRRLVMDGDVQ